MSGAPWPVWTPALLARVGMASDYGACACGRQIVRMVAGTKRCGAELHSARRCIVGRALIKAAVVKYFRLIAALYGFGAGFFITVIAATAWSI